VAFLETIGKKMFHMKYLFNVLRFNLPLCSECCILWLGATYGPSNSQTLPALVHHTAANTFMDSTN